MKKGLWTVTFMILITVVFIAALSAVNEITREKISKNAQIEKFKSILYAFDIFPDDQKESDYSQKSTTADIQWTVKEILNRVGEEIKSVRIALHEEDKNLLQASYLSPGDSLELMVRIRNDSILAIGFPMKGKGLWGTITAFGVVDGNLKRMIGIDFIEQVETPGLGARILEIEFKQFFRGLDLTGFYEGKEKPIIMVSRKTNTNLQAPTNELQAITGATQTCNGVLKMVNTDLNFYLKFIQSNFDLIKEKLIQKS